MPTCVEVWNSACASLRAAAIVVALGWTAGPASAIEGATSVDERNPIVVYARNAADRTAGGAADQLLATAQAKGEIFVIVTLRTIMRMEHALAPSSVTAQRQRLDDIQSGVAERVLGSAAALSEADRFTFIPAMAMTVNAAELRRLLNDPQVVSVVEDVPVPPSLRESVPIIHADDLFAKNVDGTGQYVAILDTGVESRHEMLRGKVRYEACFSTEIPPHRRTLCPNGRETMSGAGAAAPCGIARCDHGTHVASIAAGNSARLEGVARDAKIIAIQVFSRTQDFALDGRQRDMIRGLQRVYALRTTFDIAAVNISIGSAKYDTNCDAAFSAFKMAVDNLRSVGIATIIASGNQGYPGSVNFPACISTAVAVGNTEKTDFLAENSNQAPLVKLFAPGTAIAAAVPGNRYARKSGTSMAAPHVAGAWALLKNAKPNATFDQVLEALTCSGKTVLQRHKAAGNLRLSAPKPRIDLLGALNFLRNPNNFSRIWEFNSVGEAADWTSFRGKWGVSGGAYQAKDYGVYYQGVVTANCNTAFKAVAKLRAVDTSATNTMPTLATRVTIDNRNSTISGYEMYFTKVAPNARRNVWVYVSRMDKIPLAKNAPLGTEKVLCFSDTQTVNLNGTNTFAVDVRGEVQTFRLNGVAICTIRDTTYTSGGVAAMMFVDRRPSGPSFAVEAFQIRSLPRTAASPTAAVADVVMDPSLYEPAALHY